MRNLVKNDNVSEGLMKAKSILKKVRVGLILGTIISMLLMNTTVFATNDPLAVVNNLSTFMFGIVRAVGMILLGFGIVQIGLSFKSHDASQRANGFLTLTGGVIITFAKEILDLIVG